MSLRPRDALSLELPPSSKSLNAALFAHLFQRAVSIAGTGKRTVDGEYAQNKHSQS